MTHDIIKAWLRKNNMLGVLHRDTYILVYKDFIIASEDDRVVPVSIMEELLNIDMEIYKIIKSPG